MSSRKENVWTAEVARFDRIYQYKYKIKRDTFKEMKFCFKKIRKKL